MWLAKLDQVPGWREWKYQVTVQTFWFDGEFSDTRKEIGDFVLPADIDREHAVITSYLILYSTLTSLHDCEYYFRRDPFRGTPVRKHDHLRYICEMYFGRFYEFEEKLKECLNSIIRVVGSDHKLNAGFIIKEFSKEFKQEIRNRNNVHHHSQFEDIAIDNLFMTGTKSLDAQHGSAWKRRNDAAYRRATKEWAARVVHRSKRIEDHLNVVAKLILTNCPFLSDLVDHADASISESKNQDTSTANRA